MIQLAAADRQVDSSAFRHVLTAGEPSLREGGGHSTESLRLSAPLDLPACACWHVLHASAIGAVMHLQVKILTECHSMLSFYYVYRYNRCAQRAGEPRRRPLWRLRAAREAVGQRPREPPVVLAKAMGA